MLKHVTFTLFIWMTLAPLFAQNDVLLQAWYWNYPKTAMGHNWTDSIKNETENLAQRGFTHIWMPPLSRASFGSNSNGYDPQDLYDLGEFGLGPTGFGTRGKVDSLISAIQQAGMTAVADVVYNHRDGGKAENNLAVEGWIENYNCTKKNAGDNPYPSDRFRCYLPLGGSSPNGAGTYYIKVGSASGHSAFYDKSFKFYCETNTVGFQNLPPLTESEPNGGGGCGGNNVITLGRDIISWLDFLTTECNLGCGFEEFQLTINNGDFNPAGDTLWIYMNNYNSSYSDHYIKELYASFRSGNFQNEIKYQTYTDFSSMPSGQGSMTHLNFKPNGSPTQLNGDWDYPYFFYDYDQNVSDTKKELIDWTQWLMDSVFIGGLRMDAVKHFDPVFVADLLDSLYAHNQTPGMVVGEFYDGNPFLLRDWVAAVENNMTVNARNDIQVRVFDFALRDNLEKACDLFGYDSRNLFTSGIVNGANGHKDQSLTFVNNHDFRDGLQMVDNDPELAYAYILGNPSVGIPSVFWPDYYGTDLPAGPDAFLKEDINRLIDVRNKFIVDANSTLYLSRIGSPYFQNYQSGFANTSVIFQTKQGGIENAESLVAINFAGDTLIVEIEVDTLGNLSAGSVLYERIGKAFSPLLTVGSNSRVSLSLPPRSYGVWVLDEASEFSCGKDSIIYVDINATGLNNGSNWGNAYSSLYAAVAMSNLCEEIKEIRIKQGNYLPGITNNRNASFHFTKGVRVLGGFPTSGNPTLLDRNPSLYPTYLSGNLGNTATSDNAFHVVNNEVIYDTLTLDGIVIQHGNANGSSTDGLGGGILNSGNLHLSNCIISMNEATEGAGLYSGFGSFTILNSTIFSSNISSLSTVKTEGISQLVILGNSEIRE